MHWIRPPNGNAKGTSGSRWWIGSSKANVGNKKVGDHGQDVQDEWVSDGLKPDVSSWLERWRPATLVFDLLISFDRWCAFVLCALAMAGRDAKPDVWRMKVRIIGWSHRRTNRSQHTSAFTRLFLNEVWRDHGQSGLPQISFAIRQIVISMMALQKTNTNKRFYQQQQKPCVMAFNMNYKVWQRLVSNWSEREGRRDQCKLPPICIGTCFVSI
jgi:hypothetical protein